jgi:UDP-N-acetylglucosamine 2-epimerase (non-hydrolysing)
MKVAPVFHALSKHCVRQTLVHTGQHYDFNMSDVFFDELGLPAPDVNLGVGSGSQTQQTSRIMARFEPIMLKRKPDLVVVYGDVNSTVAAALVCAKLSVRVAHVEAGLRSFDRSMPEEINRLLTDQISDLLFTPSEDGNHNLQREGIAAEKVFLVGNVMIDTLMRMLPTAIAQCPQGLPTRYALVTLHRPSNVDDVDWLRGLLNLLDETSREIPVLFPVHPRTREKMADCRVPTTWGVQFLPPAPYLQFLALLRAATVVVTDSGGIQEETTFLRIPCVTVRENTERPVTTNIGTNILAGRDPDRLRFELKRILGGQTKSGSVPPLWDGHAAERIASIIVNAGVPAQHRCTEAAQLDVCV